MPAWAPLGCGFPGGSARAGELEATLSAVATNVPASATARARRRRTGMGFLPGMDRRPRLGRRGRPPRGNRGPLGPFGLCVLAERWTDGGGGEAHEGGRLAGGPVERRQVAAVGERNQRAAGLGDRLVDR